MSDRYNLENIKQYAGEELGVSDWITIDQERINEFAACTGDHQWIHVDVKRAAQSPLGSTIAHGYMLLSLLSQWHMALGIIPNGVKQAFNYGIDRVRFLTPVPVASRIRVRVKLLSVNNKNNGRILLKTENIIEVENSEKPAVIADTLVMLFVD